MLHILSIPLTNSYVARHGDTVEAFTSGHPWEVKKMSAIEAGRLQECKNTEFLRELRKTGFCEFKVTVRRAVHLRECVLGELRLTVIISNNNDFLAVLLEFQKKQAYSTSHHFINTGKSYNKKIPNILKLVLYILVPPGRGGGGTAIYGLYRYVLG